GRDACGSSRSLDSRRPRMEDAFYTSRIDSSRSQSMARRSRILVLAAVMGFTLGGVVPLVANEPPAPAAGDRRGAVLTFGGKLGPHDPKYREGFQAFRLRFGPGDWAGTAIQVASAWGDSQG